MAQKAPCRRCPYPYPSAPSRKAAGNGGRIKKQLYQFILSPGLIIGHTRRKFPASKGSHLPLHRISCAVCAFALFYHTAFGTKLQANFWLFQNFVSFVRFSSPSGAFMTILTRGRGASKGVWAQIFPLCRLREIYSPPPNVSIKYTILLLIPHRKKCTIKKVFGQRPK